MNKLAALHYHSSSIRLISLQFLSLAAVGTVSPFINLYLTDVGFSATLIGTLLSIGAVLALVLTPILNRIADRLMLHRRLYMVYLGGFMVAMFIFATARVQILLIFAVLLMETTTGPGMTLGMQLTMTQLSSRSKSMLGQIRSFAALGFSAASLLAGQLFAIGSYPLLFVTSMIFTGLSIQTSTIFPAKPKIKQKPVTDKPTKRNRGFYVLLASQFFVMMGIRNSFAFVFVHFHDNLGIPTADIGMWAALLAGLEVPFFMLMDSIMPKFQSRSAYIFGIIGMAAFNLMLGLVTTLPMLAMLILFRALIWPSLHLSSFIVVSDVSQPRNVATNQAILQVTIPSIAVLLTGSAFGWAFDNLGATAFFALCSIMSIIGGLIVIIGSRWFDAPPVELAQ